MHLTYSFNAFNLLLAEQMRLYFEINNLFFHGQHGFRTNHSCESALHELISKCLDNKDKKLINCLLFVDFKQAFDMIDRRVLLQKLADYGFMNNAIMILESYFTNRKKLVKIGENKSNLIDIDLGVPQGSVLGPLLFLIYINDLPLFLSDYFVRLFADDTTMLFSGSSVDECTKLCKNGIAALTEWCNYNRLYINWTKTYIMFITNRRVILPTAISFNKEKIEVVSKFKLLGITLDYRLNFLDFVSGLSLVINRKMFAIKRLFYLSKAVKLQFFKTFILPFFDFGLSLIIYFSKLAIQKLEKTYYNCLYKLFKINISSHDVSIVNNDLKKLNLMTFQHRVFQKLSFLAFNLKHSQNSPKELKACLNSNTKHVPYTFRESTKEFISMSSSKTIYGELTFKNFFAKFLNNHISFLEIFLKFDFLSINLFKLEFYKKKINFLVKEFLIIFPRFKLKINLKLF